MEHLPCGDLLGYMRKCRGVNDRYYLGEGRAQDLNNYDLVLFAKQIAAGMVFLGSRGVSKCFYIQFHCRNISKGLLYLLSCLNIDISKLYESFRKQVSYS